MCIRDRLYRCYEEVSRITRLIGEIDRINELESQESQLQNCLLYTSDAADERSSVDLGGRRIIKKKKVYTTMVYDNLYKKNTETELRWQLKQWN